MVHSRNKLDTCLEQLSRRLPNNVARFVRWITGASSTLIRIPLGIALILGGIVGFLPILGFWMVPLGLVLIAQDIPFMRPPLIRLLEWINRKWPQNSASQR